MTKFAQVWMLIEHMQGRQWLFLSYFKVNCIVFTNAQFWLMPFEIFETLGIDEVKRDENYMKRVSHSVTLLYFVTSAE